MTRIAVFMLACQTSSAYTKRQFILVVKSGQSEMLKNGFIV